MPFVKTDNVAMYGHGDWSDLKVIKSNSSPEEARRYAVANPSITFFFYCRDGMVLTNPEWAEPRVFNPGDAVFFGGKPWWGSAPQCDAYVKDGIATAYEGNLSTFKAQDITQFTTAQGLNAVDVVCFFAANLNKTVKDGQVRLAPDIDVPEGGTLAVATSYYPTMLSGNVSELQAAGITVLLTFLNNHDAAGWSEFNPNTTEGQDDASNFALQMQSIVNKYGLDGIDIDDEYSNGAPYGASLAMVTSKMRALMPDMVISKALFSDLGYFGQSYDGTTLEQTLTCGWEMSYGSSAKDMLPPYVSAGMTAASLSKGYWTGSGGYVSGDVQWMKDKGYGGFMTYAFETPANQTMLGEIVDDWMGAGNWNDTGA